jgi:beta-lactam-binding protein with PASTA domain
MSALENDGFVVGEQTPQPSADIEEGEVIQTDPPADEMVEKGTTVNLVVSSGPELVDVPTLDGYTYDNAKQLLESRGLKVGEKEFQDSSLPRDQVINTNPPGPTQLPAGSEIKLIVSRGQVSLPDVVGRSLDEARTVLQDLGLKVEVQEDPNASEDAGVVTRQSPGGNQQVANGATVTLTVSTKTDAPTPSQQPPATDGGDPGADGGTDGGADDNGLFD